MVLHHGVTLLTQLSLLTNKYDSRNTKLQANSSAHNTRAVTRRQKEMRRQTALNHEVT